jgi:hypothetical protein
MFTIDFLGNVKAENYGDTVKEMLEIFKKWV